MEGANIEDEFELFREICIDNSTDGKPPPPAPQQSPPPAPEKYVDFEEYIREKCHDKVKILDRSTFHQIQRPIIIAFNHFREKCYYHTKWLDRIYQLSLKYGDQIEFIVADQIDMDLMYPRRNPIDFFCYLVSPEDESPTMYAIDATKRIHEHFDAYKTEESLSELCEQLLSGNLYPSQPVPQKTDTLVKICVHLNYDELVTKSTKEVFLIVDLGDYRARREYEPNYEEIAEKLQDSNVDIVYIDGGQNYVPFKLNANCYPTLIFIPHNNKDNFVHYSRGPRDTENVMKFLQVNTSEGGESWRQKELSTFQYKPFTLPVCIDLTLENLNQYINENFPKSLKVLDRKTFKTTKNCVIIHFMDFWAKGVAFYIDTLQKIYQVAHCKYGYGVEYLIADLKDMDVIYPPWYSKYIQDLDIDNTTPQVYAIDQMRYTYKVDGFKTSSSLFYHSHRLKYTGFFYSQPWAISNKTDTDTIKTCVAHNLNMSIRNSKTDIFLTIYCGTYKESSHILNVLNEIAPDARSIYVKLIKMDAKFNYVPLEYSYPTYPVHFFIPHRHKDVGTIRYISANQSKEELLEFIRTNAQRSQ